ncbi:MAG: energy transducer TonB [Sphingomonas sp.]
MAPPRVAPVVPPIAAAPRPAIGPDAAAGGQGNGSGSGDGEGSGDGGTTLRWIKGEIRDSDYPRAALRQGAHGTVGLRFTVGVKGRVTDCTVTRSSGNADLDQTTCRLIVRRFRYEPSRDARGHAYADVVTGEHEWDLYRVPDADDAR